MGDFALSCSVMSVSGIHLDGTLSQEKAGIQIRLHQSRFDQIVNPGFQKPTRAQSYLCTQDLIVPKQEALGRIAKDLAARYADREALTIYIPGIGTAPFVRLLLTSDGLLLNKRLHIIGADISEAMVKAGLDEIQALTDEHTPGAGLSMDFHIGCNLLDQNDPFYRLLEEEQLRFDVILSSQFDHYFPNGRSSLLASNLKKRGVTAMHKLRQYQRCHALLKPQGRLYILDDFEGDTQSETEAWNDNWDAFVAGRFKDERVRKSLEAAEPDVGRMVRAIYPEGADEAELQRRATARRIARRKVCMEEIRPVASTMTDLKAVFGANVAMMDPVMKDLPQFKLLVATKE